MTHAERIVTNVLAEAGIQVNGPHPWDIHVHDPRFFARVLRSKNLGLGETYMDGWWDCPRLDQLFDRLLRARSDDQIIDRPLERLRVLASGIRNMQSRRRSRRVAECHYDLGNDLYAAMLDDHQQYSCAYFKNGDNLHRAQARKLRLICDKLELKSGMRLLDIGCGFGGLARFAAREYGCDVVGVNISRQQIAFAREACAELPVEIREQDYRTLGGDEANPERFERVVSVGMFEHVGPRNHRAFMRVAARCLKRGGAFLLHTIGSNRTCTCCDPWIDRYIFPGGCLPSIAQIGRAAEGLLVMEDWHNLGPHYDRTLMCWLANFRTAWPRLRARYGERFRRMWEYYLQSCAGAFRARDVQLWQIVFTRPGASQPHCRLR